MLCLKPQLGGQQMPSSSHPLPRDTISHMALRNPRDSILLFQSLLQGMHQHGNTQARKGWTGWLASTRARSRVPPWSPCPQSWWNGPKRRSMSGPEVASRRSTHYKQLDTLCRSPRRDHPTATEQAPIITPNHHASVESGYTTCRYRFCAGVACHVSKMDVHQLFFVNQPEQDLT